MSPRIRQITDTAVLAATATVVATLGARATLADVARVAGIAPATLIQRYGSKRGLLLILARQGFGGAVEVFAAARAIYASRVDALVGALCECGTGTAPDPAVQALRLAALLGDASDPDFREIAAKQMREWQCEIRGLLDEAVIWGELKACDTAALARLVHATYTGCLLLREGAADLPMPDSLRKDLELLLVPYRRE